VARCAGATTELVKEWVQQVLHQGGIEHVVSADMWKTAFG
jgi:urease accessory protein